MWAECWGLTVSKDLPQHERRILQEQFGAWCGDEFMRPGALARIARLGSSDARLARQALELGHQVLPVPGLENPLRFCRLDADAWALWHAGSCCHVAFEPGTGYDVGCAGPDASLPLMLALTEVFRACGWLLVHASGFRTPDGKVQMCLGRSGAGKSVRALSAVTGGCDFIGEDRVWLRADDLLLVPHDRRVRLLPSGVALLPELPVHKATRDPDGKFRFELDALGLSPARPAQLDGWELMLGERSASPASTEDGQHQRSQGLLLTQALWEAIGIPFLPQARANVERTIQRVMNKPGDAYWRNAEGILHRV